MAADEKCTAYEPILLHYTHGKIYSWDAEDVTKLRETHHIMGALVGSLVRSPRQNLQHGLPLQLLPEEAAVLLEYEVAKLVKLKPLKVTPEIRKDFNDHRQKTFEEQKVIMEAEREERLRQIADVIDAGRAAKKRKLEEKGDGMEVKQEGFAVKAQKLASEDVEETVLDLSIGKAVTMETGTLSVLDSATGDVPEDEAGEQTAGNVLDLTKQCHRSHEKVTLGTSSKDKGKDLMLKEGGVESQEVIRLIENVEKSREEDAKDSGSLISGEDTSACTSSFKGLGTAAEEMTSSRNTSRQGGEKSADMPLGKEEMLGESLPGGPPSPPRVVAEKGKEKKQPEHFNLQACLVQIPTVSPYSSYEEMTSWNFPSSDHEQLRFRVFKYFWEKGYYLTTGGKFGGDFLVYPGDPFLFHSFYVAVCLPYTKRLNALDVVSYGRLASNVKKTILLCSLNEDDEVVHTSVQWTGIN